MSSLPGCKKPQPENEIIYIHVYIKSSYGVKKQGSETEIHYLWSLNALDTNTNP